MTTTQGLTKRCKVPAKLPSFNTCITLLQKYEKIPASQNLPSTSVPELVQQRLKATALNTTDNKMVTKVSTKKSNVWIEHCRKVYAEAKAEGEKNSWRDTLIKAQATYTKKPKPVVDPNAPTWCDWVREHATLSGITYGQAMRDPECSRGWKEFKATASTKPEEPTKPKTTEEPQELVMNAEMYYKLSFMPPEKVKELLDAHKAKQKPKFVIPRFADCVPVR